MFPSARLPVVFGAALIVLSFAIWRTRRKGKNSARRKEPSGIDRNDTGGKPQNSNTAIEEIARELQPSFPVKPGLHESEAERQGIFDADQKERFDPPVNSLDEPALAAPLDSAAATCFVTNGVSESSVIPPVEISGIYPARPTEPCDIDPVHPLVTNPLKSDSSEIIIPTDSKPLNLLLDPKTHTIGPHDRSEEVPSNEANSDATEHLQTSGETSDKSNIETEEIGEDRHGTIESRQVVRSPQAQDDSPQGSPNSLTPTAPIEFLIKTEMEVSGVRSDHESPTLLAHSETIQSAFPQDASKQIWTNLANDLQTSVETSASATNESSALKENREAVVEVSPGILTSSSDTAGNYKDVDLVPSPADPTASCEGGSEPQTRVSANHLPIRANENGQSIRKLRGPQRYEAPVRTPDSLTAPRKPRTVAVGLRTRGLNVAIHVHFGRRNRCEIGLLPERPEGFPENITVTRARGPEEWSASQDEWYSDLIPEDLGRILREGAQWEKEGDPNVRWTLAGRDVYVLVGKPESGIFAFVSTTRLLLGEDHLVLCIKGIEETVRRAIAEAGCTAPVLLDEDQGVPNGWVLFRNVLATTASPHNPEDGIINILRPVHDVEVELRGGIRIRRSQWLYGHPPQVRLRGDRDNLDVVIDQQLAICDESNNYSVPGWDEPGVHRIFCGGATASYELVVPPSQWDSFPAFTYVRTAIPNWPMTICGPFVRTARRNTVLLVRTGSTYLLGPVPGQIVFATPASDLHVPAFLGAADFPIVWAVPASPLQVKKGTSTIQLLHNYSPESFGEAPKARDAIWRWAALIMEASYKRLLLEPDTDDTRKLWAEYKTIARRIKKSLR